MPVLNTEMLAAAATSAAERAWRDTLSWGRVAGVWEVEDGEIVVTPFEDLPEGPLQTEIARVAPLLPRAAKG